MKQLKFLLLAVIGLLYSISINAQHLFVDGIFYKILSTTDKTVEVASLDEFYEFYNYRHEYSGSVSIPETFYYNGIEYSVTSIGGYAFVDCYNLNSVKIPNSVTSIGEYAFSNCSSLNSIVLPNSVMSIGEAAFTDCTSLNSIVLPNGVTTIESAAFYNCSSLTSIEIPNSVTTIKENPFQGCSSLVSIIIDKENEVYDSREGCNAIIETSSNTLVLGCKSTIIPNSVTSIGMKAFLNCSGLTSIEIPNSVTSIGVGAFYNCSSLTSIKIPNSVTSIGSEAFINTAWFINQPDGVVYMDNYLLSYKGTMSSNTSVYIKKGTVLIADYAFENYLGLTSIEIPNSVTRIGKGSFSGCSGLTSIEIPNSVTSIGHCAFQFCSGLTSIEIPNSVTSIGEYAFYRCSSLNSIKIPNSVTNIGAGGFHNCSSLTSIEIPNSVTGIGDWTFAECSSLTSVVIGNSVTSIGDRTFYNCSSLTSVEIPNSVTSIGYAIFRYCSSLTSVVIGNSVTSIGDYAFDYCFGLTSITSHIPANNLFPIKSNVFESVDKSNCTLNVPYGAKEKYESTAGWNEFTNIVELIEISTYHELTYIVDSLVYQTDSVFAGDSIKLPEPPAKEGYTFVGWEGLPDIMPDCDVEVKAKFNVNAYCVTYKVDGLTYHTDSISYGATIVPVGAPTKEGHTFISWEGLPDVMPAKDVEVTAKFDVNVYRITYKVDSITYQTDSIVFAESIVPPAAPTKEGHTFVVWEGLPDVMPAKDIEVTAKFDVNVYRITYKVDSITYQTDSVIFAESIVPPVAPTKEGHTFISWEGLPDVMPAKDVEVTAKFDVNVYRITYKIDSITYQTDSIVFAESIVPPAAPTKEGHTFIGWEGLPDVMPAKDIEVTAKFDVNVYSITYKVDSITYQTDSIAFSATIVPPTAPAKEGYLFDGWEGLPDVMPAKDVEVMAKYSLNPVQTDEQGVRYELNATGDAFEAKGTTDELVADIVLPATIYSVPVNGIAVEAFKNAEIQSIVIPATIQEVGDDAFVGCTELRWVDWQAQVQVRAECFDAPEVHGNMLLFCYGEQVPDYAGNVVVNGKAKEIVLMDARPYASPYDYEAENISFTKTFTKETMIGTGAGWEGIVVPFDVERIVFGDKVIAPFGATGQYSDIPCWLAQMKDENFVMTDAIKADKAYIMAVPNSEEYDDDYNVEGDVRFEATNAVVKATANSATAPANEHALVGTYEPVEIDADVFALNDDDYLDAEEDLVLAPGSVFVQGMREVRPFEAYVRSTKALQMACLKIGSVLTTHITNVQSGKTDAEAWYTLQGKRLNTKPAQTGFYLHGGKLEFVRQQ